MKVCGSDYMPKVECSHIWTKFGQSWSNRSGCVFFYLLASSIIIIIITQQVVDGKKDNRSLSICVLCSWKCVRVCVCVGRDILVRISLFVLPNQSIDLRWLGSQREKFSNFLQLTVQILKRERLASFLTCSMHSGSKTFISRSLEGPFLLNKTTNQIRKQRVV